MGIRGSEWLILLLIVLLLFGARRLPDAARSLGQSLRIFKKELSAEGGSKEGRDAEGSSTAPSEPPRDAPPASP